MLLLTVLSVPGVRAQAPASLHGSTLFQTITSGDTTVFDTSGYTVVFIANAANSYSRVDLLGTPNANGTFTYVQSGADAVLTITDTRAGIFTADYNFNDLLSGGYLFTQGPSAFQDGSFIMYAGQAPASLAGKTVTLDISDGGGGADASGTETILFTSSGYTLTDNSGIHTGTYTYSLANRSTGKVTVSSSSGNGLLYLSFTDSASGGFAARKSNGHWQIGTIIIPDTTPPTVTFTTPTPNQQWSNAMFTVNGKASDDVGVTFVDVSSDGNTWIDGVSSNSWVNWTADNVPLTPGTNTIYARALDGNGNFKTNTVKMIYILSTPLAVSMNGKGTISPAYNNALLPIGKNVTLTATPAVGYAFTNWTDGSSFIITNKPTLTFLMASNLSFIANFIDIAKPTVAITNIPVSGNVSNAAFTVKGKAGDNLSVSNVFYNLNNGGWLGADLANGFTNWSAYLTLTPGTNLLATYAVDTTGNLSLTNTVKLVYILSAQLTVSMNGKGSIAPAYNNALLQIGKNYTLTATPAVGFAFTNWTDGSSFIITNKPTLTFLMASNLSFIANFIDIAKPTVAITNIPVSGNVSNAAFTVKGKAGDNLSVSNVFYNLNNGGWLGVDSTNYFSNWSALLDLTPGTNVLSTYAIDTTGNLSLTNTVKLVYILSAQLTVSTNGKGSIAPAYNNALLQIGKNYTLTATPAVGFIFTNWADGSGFIITNKPALTFLMASNLSFIANFVDIAKPVLTVTTPTAATSAGNDLYLASGKALDNAGVTNVLYNLNSMGWFPAGPANSWTNWTTTLGLTPGTNYFSAYAVDSSGNLSITNNTKFLYTTAPASLSGLAAAITPDDSAIAPFGVAFGATTFSQIATDTNNVNGLGSYTYTKQTPSSGLLKLTYTAPPTATNEGLQTIKLAFTAPNIARYTNGLDTGGIIFTSTPTLVLPAILNQTVVAVNNNGDGESIVFTAGNYIRSNLLTHVSNTNLNYTYAAYSPLGALLKNLDSNGQDYTVITFVGTNYGTAYSESYDRTGNFTQTNQRVFGVKSQKSGGNAPINLVNHSTLVINNNYHFKLTFVDSTNFVTTHDADTNGIGTYDYTRIGTNSGNIDLNYSTLPGAASIYFQFVSPNFAIITNSDNTLGAAIWK